MTKTTNINRTKRKNRIRKKLKQVSNRPRLSVHRTNQHIYAQIIDDKSGKTLACSSDLSLQKDAKIPSTKSKLTKTEIAAKVGKDLAIRSKKANISAVYFDRGAYKFHGRVRALAQSAKANGLEF